MTKTEAKKQVAGHLVAKLMSGSTCDDLKGSLSADDYERVCAAEQELANELQRRYIAVKELS